MKAAADKLRSANNLRAEMAVRGFLFEPPVKARREGYGKMRRGDASSPQGTY